ncbi:hypothetical protein ACOMHN_001746 [Nucella lapillus]
MLLLLHSAGAAAVLFCAGCVLVSGENNDTSSTHGDCPDFDLYSCWMASNYSVNCNEAYDNHNCTYCKCEAFGINPFTQSIPEGCPQFDDYECVMNSSASAVCYRDTDSDRTPACPAVDTESCQRGHGCRVTKNMMGKSSIRSRTSAVSEEDDLPNDKHADNTGNGESGGIPVWLTGEEDDEGDDEGDDDEGDVDEVDDDEGDDDEGVVEGEDELQSGLSYTCLFGLCDTRSLPYPVFCRHGQGGTEHPAPRVSEGTVWCTHLAESPSDKEEPG